MGPAQFPSSPSLQQEPSHHGLQLLPLWTLEGFVGLRLGLESITLRAQNHHQISPGWSGFHGVTMATNFHTHPAFHYLDQPAAWFLGAPA